MQEVQEVQLSKAQAVAILGLAQSRDELTAALDELVELYAAKYGLPGAIAQVRGRSPKA